MVRGRAYHNVCDPRMLTSKCCRYKTSHSLGEGRRMKKLQFCLVFFSLLIMVVSAAAQVQNGQFTGTITDPSGAAIANAKVTAVNPATNLSVAATTNATGLYTLKELPPGSYKITAEAPGFRTSSNADVKLN